MTWLDIKKRMDEYTRQYEEGLINLEEWRCASICFLVSEPVEVVALRDGYATVCKNLGAPHE